MIGIRSAINRVTGIRIVTESPRFSVAIRMRNSQNCTGIERSKPKFMMQLCDGGGAAAVAQHHLRRIARQQVHQGKHQHRHQQHRGHDLQHAATQDASTYTRLPVRRQDDR